MVKKDIANVDSSRASVPDCIPVVVLKNCEPELSYILAELLQYLSERVLFYRLLKGLVSGPCFKKCLERSTAKNYCLVGFLSGISKVFAGFPIVGGHGGCPPPPPHPITFFETPHQK